MPGKGKGHRGHGGKASGPACIFCESEEENEEVYGKMLRKSGITIHYFCMLFSSGLWQRGKRESDGVLGFLPADIRREQKRGSRLSCQYCKKKGATIGCVVSNCRKTFHFRCGREAGGLSQFFDEFRSYCPEHRPVQGANASVSDRLAFYGTAKSTCSICMTAVEARASNDTLRSPCCRHAWFHRNCMQRYATSAGLYFFKCPLCNNKDIFQAEMLQFGIYIPDQDAAWEQEPNAYHDLLERYDQCDAENCQCPKGRKHDGPAGSRWELLLCDACGSSGSHDACGSLTKVKKEFLCPSCCEVITAVSSSAKKKSSSPRTPSQEDVARRQAQKRAAAEREQRAARRRCSPTPEDHIASLRGAVSRLRNSRGSSSSVRTRESQLLDRSPIVRVTRTTKDIDVNIEDSDDEVDKKQEKTEAKPTVTQTPPSSKYHGRPRKRPSPALDLKDVVKTEDKDARSISSRDAAESDVDDDNSDAVLVTRRGKALRRRQALNSQEMNNNSLSYNDGSENSESHTDKENASAKLEWLPRSKRLREQSDGDDDDSRHHGHGLCSIPYSTFGPESVKSESDTVETPRRRGRPPKRRGNIHLFNARNAKSASSHEDSGDRATPAQVFSTLRKQSPAFTRNRSNDGGHFTPEADSSDTSSNSSTSSSPRRQLPCFGKATWRHRRTARFTSHTGVEKREQDSSDDSVDADLMRIASRISRHNSDVKDEGASTSGKSGHKSVQKEGCILLARPRKSRYVMRSPSMDSSSSAGSLQAGQQKIAVNLTEKSTDASSSVKITVPGVEISIRSGGKTTQGPSLKENPELPSLPLPTVNPLDIAPSMQLRGGCCEAKRVKAEKETDTKSVVKAEKRKGKRSRSSGIPVGMETALLTSLSNDEHNSSELETFSLAPKKSAPSSKTSVVSLSCLEPREDDLHDPNTSQQQDRDHESLSSSQFKIVEVRSLAGEVTSSDSQVASQLCSPEQAQSQHNVSQSYLSQVPFPEVSQAQISQVLYQNVSPPQTAKGLHPSVAHTQISPGLYQSFSLPVVSHVQYPTVSLGQVSQVLYPSVSQVQMSPGVHQSVTRQNVLSVSESQPKSLRGLLAEPLKYTNCTSLKPQSQIFQPLQSAQIVVSPENVWSMTNQLVIISPERQAAQGSQASVRQVPTPQTLVPVQSQAPLSSQVPVPCQFVPSSPNAVAQNALVMPETRKSIGDASISQVTASQSSSTATAVQPSSTATLRSLLQKRQQEPSVTVAQLGTTVTLQAQQEKQAMASMQPGTTLSLQAQQERQFTLSVSELPQGTAVTYQAQQQYSKSQQQQHTEPQRESTPFLSQTATPASIVGRASPSSEQSSLQVSQTSSQIDSNNKTTEETDECEVFVLLTDSSDDDIQIDESKSSVPRRRRMMHKRSVQRPVQPPRAQPTARSSVPEGAQVVGSTLAPSGLEAVAPAPLLSAQMAHGQQTLPTNLPTNQPTPGACSGPSTTHETGRGTVPCSSDTDSTVASASQLQSQPSQSQSQTQYYLSSQSQPQRQPQPQPQPLNQPRPPRPQAQPQVSSQPPPLLLHQPQSQTHPPSQHPSSSSTPVYRSLSQVKEYVGRQFQASQRRPVFRKGGVIDLTEDLHERRARERRERERQAADSDLEIVEPVVEID